MDKHFTDAELAAEFYKAMLEVESHSSYLLMMGDYQDDKWKPEMLPRIREMYLWERMAKTPAFDAV